VGEEPHRRHVLRQHRARHRRRGELHRAPGRWATPRRQMELGMGRRELRSRHRFGAAYYLRDCPPEGWAHRSRRERARRGLQSDLHDAITRRETVRSFRLVLTIVLCWVGWTTTAAALTAEVPTRDPSVVGEAYAFRAVVSGSTGTTLYRWNFGDGVPSDFVAGASDVLHTYTQPGHYPLIVTIKDDSSFTSVAFVHIVHYPITARAPTASTDIVYDATRKRVCNVNEDDDSVSVADAVGLTSVAEIPVYQRPVALAIAPSGKLWVVHRTDYAVAIVDLDHFTIEHGFRLPYASQPVGLAMSPLGDAAYITLMALGKLVKLDPATGNVLATVDIGSWARGVSVTQD